MIRARELLLHPLAIASIAVLVANDHWWKDAHPGALTGKLSDFAGLTFFPVLVLIALDVFWPHRRSVTVLAAPILTALVFVLVKCLPSATEAYREILGFLQSPLSRSHLPVQAVTDPTDLVAVPCVLISVALAYRCGFVQPRLVAICESRRTL